MQCETGDGRLERRRHAIVHAAAALFLEKGVKQTTLQEIVDRSGGSMATLYKLFDGKAGLLQAVMHERVIQSAEQLVQLVDTASSPAEVLQAIAHNMQCRLENPAEADQMRVMIAYCMEHIEFAREVHQGTKVKIHNQLGALFTRWQEEGLQLTGPPHLLGSMFMSMLVQEFQEQTIYFVDAKTGVRNLRDQIDLFCRMAGLA